jgi:hypothetical protein
MSDLLPCPFCGGEASFKPRSFKASCDRCGAHVPNGAVSSNEAIAAWNTRVPVQALLDTAEPAMAEALAALEADNVRLQARVRFLERKIVSNG